MPPGVSRYTVAEAADMLGISTGAVRNRLSRGSLRSVKEDGTVYVLLSADMSRDTGRDTRDTPHDMPPSDSSALISAKDETISTLRDQLEAERQAHAEARRIIAGLVERIPPAIREAPQEPTEAAETVEEAPEGAGPHSAAGEAQDELGTERARREMAETTLREGMAEERRRREQAERERDDLRQELEAITRARRESPQTVEEASEGASPWSATGEAQERAQRPWWRRIIGR